MALLLRKLKVKIGLEQEMDFELGKAIPTEKNNTIKKPL